MTFAVSSSAMNGTEAVLNCLDAILLRVEDEIHEMEIVDADSLQSSAWYESCRPDRRNMLEKCAQSMLYRPNRTHGPHLHRILVTDEGTARSARDTANTPLCVLVENADSDGAIVKFAIMVFAHRGVWELCYGFGALRTPPAVVIESRGGHGELNKLLETRVKGAKAKGLPPRIIVMTDSDGEWVGDVKAHAREIRDKCSEFRVPCPPLNKRKAENYIPDAIWMAWSAGRERTSIRPAVEALLRLSYHQRDHVNLEKSNTPPWNPSLPDVAALFAGVSAADEELLRAAGLRSAASQALAFALEAGVSHASPVEVRNRDRYGDLEGLAQFIQDGL